VRVALLGSRERLAGDDALNATRWTGPVAPLSLDVLDGAAVVIEGLFGAQARSPHHRRELIHRNAPVICEQEVVGGPATKFSVGGDVYDAVRYLREFASSFSTTSRRSSASSPDKTRGRPRSRSPLPAGPQSPTDSLMPAANGGSGRCRPAGVGERGPA
jgi:hypothetical protein